MLNLFLIID